MSEETKVGTPVPRRRKGKMPAVIPLTEFGKYTLVAKLGRGGMAEVFLAYMSGPAGFKKPVVIKRILPDLSQEPRLVQMFFDEARLAARLQHPHVVQTYEVGQVADSVFLAMEYLEGQPLSEVVRRSNRVVGGMPPEIAAAVVADALDGLHYAHELADFDGTPLGVVHRDVSPQNIFVTYDGVVKVLDFGVAKAATQVVQTRVGAIKGKYAYMAPEQGRGTSVDRRVDVWGGGVVLWESLVGRRLFKGDNDYETLRLVLDEPVPRPTDFVPGVPDALVRITERALERDVADRYPTAQAMREDLHAYLGAAGARVGRTELSAFMRQAFGPIIEKHRGLLGAAIGGESGVRSAETVLEASASSFPGLGLGLGLGLDESSVDTVPSGSPFPESAPEPSRSGPESLLPLVGKPAGPSCLLASIVGAMLVAAFVAFVVVFTGAEVEPLAPVSAPRVVAEDDGVSVEPTPPSEPEEAPVGPEPSPPIAEVEAEAPPALDPEPARVARDRGRSARVDRRPPRDTGRSARAARDPADDDPSSSPRPPPSVGGAGALTLDTVPWSVVSLGGRQLGTTPLIGVSLPAGVHVLTLRNPEQDITTRYRVVITAGETTVRRLGIE